MQNKTKDFYNNNAENWTAKKVNSFHHEIPFRKFEALLKEGDNILDIGCASGIHVPLFLGIGRKLNYEGIDISEEMIKIAKARYPQLDFNTVDIMDFNPNKKYDGFWSAATLMHIPREDHEKLFSKIKNLIVPGGLGYITVPSERPNPESDTDQRLFTLFSEEEFKSTIFNQGWKVLESGNLPASNEHPIWNWFIVQLPK
jgi:trans-aconitate methyltransferase